MQQDNETTAANPPRPEVPDPAAPAVRPDKAPKPRKKRAPNKPKVKPVKPPELPEAVVDPAEVKALPDTPVVISDDDPAIRTEPDPKIDAVAAARALIAAADAQDQAPKNVQIRQVGMKLSDLQDRLNESRNRKTPAYVPPAPTERQQTTIDAEMAAGQRRVAHFAAIERARVQLAPNPNEPVNTPVHRPADFVPGINSKDPAIGSQDLK
jgi:hypothetical protein